MPRLTAIKHPMFGRIPVNTVECPECGVPAGETCYFLCSRSPAYYSADQEKAEALAYEAATSTPDAYMRHTSMQHRAAGFGCPYDGYDPPEPDRYDDDGGTGAPLTPAELTHTHEPAPLPQNLLPPFTDDDLPF